MTGPIGLNSEMQGLRKGGNVLNDTTLATSNVDERIQSNVHFNPIKEFWKSLSFGVQTRTRTMSSRIVGAKPTLILLPDVLNTSGFQDPKALLPSSINMTAASRKGEREMSSVDALVETDEGRREDSSPNIEEPLTDETRQTRICKVQKLVAIAA